MKKKTLAFTLLIFLLGGCLLLPPEVKLQNPFDGPLPFFATLVENLASQIGSSNTSNSIEVSGVIDTVAEGQAFNIGVKLSNAPGQSTTITVTSNSSSLTLNGANTFTLTFTNSNYFDEQIITVISNTDNNNVNESVTLTFKADNFSEVSKVVTVSDDLIPIITNTPSSIDEGKSATISIKLSKEIAVDKELTITSNNSAITINGETSTNLTFTPDTWNNEQNITIAAVNDNNTDSETANVSFSMIGSATVNYSVTNNEPTVANINNTFSVTAPTSIEEGSTTTAQIALSIQAETTQTVSLTSDHPSIEINPSTLLFSPTNSTVNQSFTLTSLLDNNTSDEIVNITISSSDVETTTLTINHSETTGDWLVMTGSTILDEGINSTLSIKLAFKPHEDIPVNIMFSDTSIVSASPAILTFSSTNYDTAQDVTINSIQDNNIVAETLSLEISAIGFQSKNSTTIKYDDEALGGMTLGLLKTGQTTEIVSGDDGTHQSGLDRVYTDMEDGTILDNTTGLTWQKCSRGQNNDSGCSGIANKTSRSTSEAYCSSLNLASKTWRLPNILELSTLVSTSQTNPTIDSTYFPQIPLSLPIYWTYEDVGSSDGHARIINFRLGTANDDAKFRDHYVRCVSGSSSPNSSYTDNGDGTITDNITKIIWQKCNKGQSNDSLCTGIPDPNNDWEDAISYCSNLNLASKTWRLPNKNELQSMFDYTRYRPTINTIFFPYTLTKSDVYWSSSSLTSYTGNNISYMIDAQEGNIYFGSRETEKDPNNSGYRGHYVRCVSGP